MTRQVNFALAGPGFTTWLLYPSTAEVYLGLIVYAAVVGLCFRAIGERTPRTVERLATFLESSTTFAFVVAVEVTLTAAVLGVAADQSQTFFVKALAFGLLSGMVAFVLATLFEWSEPV